MIVGMKVEDFEEPDSLLSFSAGGLQAEWLGGWSFLSERVFSSLMTLTAVASKVLQAMP